MNGLLGLIPHDNDQFMDEYASETGGICGQACLAYLTGQSIGVVLDNWQRMGLEWRGWSGWRQLRAYLQRKSFTVKQKSAEKYVESGICRIQWVGKGPKQSAPFYGWPHWSIASAHTHFIVVDEGIFYCNGEGRLRPRSELEAYLYENKGVITSILEVKKEDTK
jgi:hypothetical protein